MKKLLATLLSVAMVVAMAAGCNGSTGKPEGSTAEAGESNPAAESGDKSGAEAGMPDMSTPEDPMAAVPQAEILAKVPKTEPKGTVVYGTPTEPDENIMPGFTNPAPNQNMRYMIMGGYSTFSYSKDNTLVRNNVALKDFKQVENPDGTLTFEEEIYDNLKWSDGSPITAKDYVFNMLLSSHKNMTELGGDGSSGMPLVGYKAFNEGDGTVPFKGVRLLGDYKFSVTVAKEELPNYYIMDLVATQSPFPMKALGLSPDVVDKGEGAAFSKALDMEEMKAKLMDPVKGFVYTYPVTDAPYKFVEFDKANKALVMEANPEFLGTYDGWKPQIKKVIIKHSQDKLINDELASGAIDVAAEASGKKNIEDGLAKMKASNGKLAVLKYERNGFGDIQFQCDVGATQFKEVRQAVTYAIDRVDLMNKYTGGYGALVHAEYGLAQPEYKANKKLFDEKMNTYSFNLNKAKECLVKGGWTLNSAGKPFVEGTDKVRYKKLEDGSLMACQINWANTGTAVAELLNATLPSNLASIGVALNSESVNFPKMIKAMYAPLGSAERKQYNMFVLGLGFAIIKPVWQDYSEDPVYLSNNPSQLKDKKLTELINKMKATKPGDKKTWYAEYGELQLLLNDLMGKVPLYSDIYHSFYNTKVKNLNLNSLVSFGRAVVYATLAE